MKRSIATFAVLLFAIHSSVSAEDFVGKVLFASGDVRVVHSDGSQQALQRKDGILNNDHLITADGVLQIKFQDGGFMSLQKHSEMKVENYHFEGSENGKESAIFSLLRGGLRALSGAIGHKRPGRYQLRTVVATIGIRGTAYSALLCQQDCSQMNGEELADGLHARTTEGTIFVENDGGVLDIPAGKAAFVPDVITLPIYTEFNPSFATIEPRAHMRSKPQAQAKQVNRANMGSSRPSPTSKALAAVPTAKAGLSSTRGALSMAPALSNAETSNFDRFVTRANSFSPIEGGETARISEPNIASPGLVQPQLVGLESGELAETPAGSISQSASRIAPALTPQVTPSFSPAQSFNPGIAQSITIAPTASESVTEVLSNTNGISLESGLNQLNVNTPIINNNYSLPGNLIGNPLHH